MAWRTWYVNSTTPSDIPRAVLESMGLGALRYDKTRQPKTYSVKKNKDDMMSSSLVRFGTKLFDAQPSLRVIIFRYDLVPLHQVVDTPATWLRTVTLTTNASPNSYAESISYNDQIAYEVIDAVIQAQLR